ncbi:citrate:proton symporter [Domibacillus sp. 8LH]|uniref:CitMHS family transporter n=1 Tax=unclassified Domibacillus TaxID=2632383 RepID=UPI0028E4E9B7|nr:citrate:proton symporter [Domibacillus sp. DTU_2020_1001157_1_SI_ALB_TIR_016]WNS82409.1 citrate:proton symporter [Domibacillus sp. DTU_2020_1001157_1_SI_ALB_TIR_016]
MLAILGFSMVAVFMYLIMSGRLSALIALMIVPAAFALFAGFGSKIGEMALTGITDLAPTGVMLMFAILYFGIMIDAGLFDPVVGKILKAVKGDPMKIVVGTAVLAMIVSLDGDGTTTYMITISAMLPLYQRLKMNPLILPAVALMAVGVTNLTPWGGPTARAASALSLDMQELFNPLIPVMAAGALWVIAAAYWMGKKERNRLGVLSLEELNQPVEGKSYLTFFGTAAVSEEDAKWKRPKLLWFNFALTIALMVMLILGVMPLPILFMLAFAVAITINYPNVANQKERIAAHAGNVLAVVSLVFAAGIFTGILSGTEMVDAMAKSLIAIIPDSMGPHLPVITALASMPFTFFMSNDAFYFGVLPIIAEAASNYGVSAVEIGRASLLGQPVHLLSPLVASTYLLVGMAKVDFGQYQRFTILWTVGTAVVMTVAAILLGVISL